MSAETELPAPGDDFYEWETIKAFSYTLEAWRRESVSDRARMMAHELFRGMRESYYAEKMSGKSDKDKAKQTAPWDMEAMRQKMFTK